MRWPPRKPNERLVFVLGARTALLTASALCLTASQQWLRAWVPLVQHPRRQAPSLRARGLPPRALQGRVAARLAAATGTLPEVDGAVASAEDSAAAAGVAGSAPARAPAASAAAVGFPEPAADRHGTQGEGAADEEEGFATDGAVSDVEAAGGASEDEEEVDQEAEDLKKRLASYKAPTAGFREPKLLDLDIDLDALDLEDLMDIEEEFEEEPLQPLELGEGLLELERLVAEHEAGDDPDDWPELTEDELDRLHAGLSQDVPLAPDISTACWTIKWIEELGLEGDSSFPMALTEIFINRQDEMSAQNVLDMVRSYGRLFFWADEDFLEAMSNVIRRYLPSFTLAEVASIAVSLQKMHAHLSNTCIPVWYEIRQRIYFPLADQYIKERLANGKKLGGQTEKLLREGQHLLPERISKRFSELLEMHDVEREREEEIIDSTAMMKEMEERMLAAGDDGGFQLPPGMDRGMRPPGMNLR